MSGVAGSADDRQAVIDLAVAYCWALDTRDWDRLDDVFTEDVEAFLAVDLVGVAAVKELVSSVLGPLSVSQHMVNTHQIEVDGDRATARCYLHAQHVRRVDGADLQYIVGGRYDDELVRTADGWRISKRVLTVLWTAGDPAVLQR